ncbi:hypothetical protein ATK17_3761 [Branchiibius hedensis]|uniref:TrbL/VirB6 plasmid conjugal transfer protein n=1 Tax=Branchiibius hedensis TaxID=672460 RepID=A0A2Y9BLE2_9MICO|nr:hypothetical protein [Branchiibius hedensis]PWJ23268.1 hypothetical protein ATK17_3761 [Branchiibius hedensis]SSA58957.1 hypothetical protein SAMN04489750_3761 [Branchiibius hedensis]
MFGIPGIPNPFSWLAGEAGKVVVDGWTMAMLGLWNAGLWMLRLVLNIMDAFLTPDLSENGPGSVVYQYTFWIAGSLVVLMLMLQLGTAAIRRDGKSIATALMGTGQFILVWCCWIGGAVIVLAAAGGLTRALMEGLLKVNTWSAWQPFQNFSTKDINDGTVATVLGGLGCLLWLASIGHLMVMLTRAGALLVLATTTPVSAAGLVANAGKAWFWKSLRWFIAAAFSPVIMVLVLGVGVQLTTGVANGMTDSMQKAIGTAVPGVILILISTFCPMALFKLLAFVDPGTTSGAALRAGLEAQGGIQGLFGGGKGAGDEGSSAASSSDGNGTSQGEASSEDATSGRFNKAEGGMLQAAGGALGGVAATALGAMHTIGTRGAAIGADLTNQMGVGHSNYYPDFSSGKQQKNNNSNDNPDRHGGKDAGDGDDDNPMGPNDPSSTTSPTDPTTGQGQPSDPTNGPTNPNQATQGPDMPAPTQGGPPSTSPQGGQQGGGKSEGGPKGGGGTGGAGGSGGAAGGASEAAVVAV